MRSDELVSKVLSIHFPVRNNHVTHSGSLESFVADLHTSVVDISVSAFLREYFQRTMQIYESFLK